MGDSQDSRVDTLLYQADSLRFAKNLRNRSLDINMALTPDDYFTKAQREAHKIESPLRHTIVIGILLFLWVVLKRASRGRESNSPST